MQALDNNINLTCSAQSVLGFNCLQISSYHTARVSSLSIFSFQNRTISNASNLTSNNFSFLEYLSTQGLFGTDKNNIHCALCHRTVEIIDVSTNGKIAYVHSEFHKSNCRYFEDPALISFNYLQYNRFEERIETFHNWPSEKEQKPFELASSGFRFLQLPDTVKCFCCAAVAYDWEPNDKVDEVHATLFPECEFLNQIKGFAYVAEMLRKKGNLQEILPPKLTYNRCLAIEFPGYLMVSKTFGVPHLLEHTEHLENKNILQPIYPAYKTKVARKASFARECSKDFYCLLSEFLADEGFFLFKEGEYVRCFSCGFGVEKWTDHTISPMLLHLQFRTKCGHIMAIMTEDRMAIIKNTQYLFTKKSSQQARASMCATMLEQNHFNNMNNPANPLYASLKNRRKVLNIWNNVTWMVTNKKLDEMAQAGLFYSMDGAKCGIYCFHCGNRVDGWKHSDNIAKEHTYLYQECRWIEYRISPAYIISEKDVDIQVRPNLRIAHYSFSMLNSRIESLLNQWPGVDKAPSIESIAEAGFFFFAEPDEVCCFACNIKINDWHPGDIPIFRHFKDRSYCGFVKSDEGQRLIEKAYCTPKYKGHTKHNSQTIPSASNNTEVMPIPITQPIFNKYNSKYPAYITFHARVQSFQNSNWPHGDVAGLDLYSMAKAGFFYNHNSISLLKDGVCCFQCGQGLMYWRPGEIPNEEHEKFQPNCSFIKDILKK